MSAVAMKHPSSFSPEEREKIVAWLSHPDPRIELIGGALRPRAMAKVKYGGAQMAIGAQLLPLQGPAPREGGGGPGGPVRWWLSQDVDLYLAGEGVRPDVCGWRMDRHPTLPEEENVDHHLGVITVPPDWVCEILSKSTSARDRGVKWRAYQQAGVEWYWIVDLRDCALTVYQRTPRSYEAVEIVGPDEIRRLPPFEGIEFPLAPVFVLAQQGPDRPAE
jgi:hypothetical protein